ncbi:hypothetical protein FS749_006261 [Ceratobasidium sp. UAMH 11750]|nr:hypothetical protein FS749_006261 [Ceratobasidium sp. UAMH 11750]
MSSGKRPRAAPQPQPISLGDSSKKRVKFTSAHLSGSRSQFTLRPAQSSARDAGADDSNRAEPVHFNRGGFYQQLLEAWSAEQAPPDLLPGSLEFDDNLAGFAAEDDMEDVALSACMSASGKGQNEMLTTWLDQYGTSYLQRLFIQYDPPDTEGLCLCGKAVVQESGSRYLPVTAGKFRHFPAMRVPEPEPECSKCAGNPPGNPR